MIKDVTYFFIVVTPIPTSIVGHIQKYSIFIINNLNHFNHAQVDQFLSEKIVISNDNKEQELIKYEKKSDRPYNLRIFLNIL